MMNTCSCMRVTPSAAVSMDPRAVLSSDTPLMLGRRARDQQGRFVPGSPAATRLQYRHPRLGREPPGSHVMLLNPNNLQRRYPDRRSGEIMAATVDFFESRGKAQLKSDDHERVWYSDFLEHVGRERIFASLLTPSAYGADDCRWDTYRISEFAEIVGFYGLNYWYPFQVTALGLGPIW